MGYNVTKNLPLALRVDSKGGAFGIPDVLLFV